VSLDREAAFIKAFGRNVRRERIRAGLSQEKLAEYAELNPRTVQRIEAGEIAILLTTAARVRKALGCGWEKLA
jgi:transcriptional regulator with XRE-family HTH domain